LISQKRASFTTISKDVSVVFRIEASVSFFIFEMSASIANKRPCKVAIASVWRASMIDFTSTRVQSQSYFRVRPE
jgi:hypothetical protein